MNCTLPQVHVPAFGKKTLALTSSRGPLGTCREVPAAFESTDGRLAVHGSMQRCSPAAFLREQTIKYGRQSRLISPTSVRQTGRLVVKERTGEKCT